VKHWRIHLAWTLALPMITFLWGRWTLAHHKPEPRPRVGIRTGPLPRPQPATMSASAQSSSVSAAEDDVATVRSLLRSESEEDRSKGAKLLYRIPAGPEKKALILLELASSDPDLRDAALNQLLNLPAAESVPHVQHMLKSDPEAYLRRTAAQILGVLGGSGTMEALLAAVHDPERYVQVTAAGSLNQLGLPGSAEDLVPRVAADLSSPDAAIRGEAIKDLTLLKLPSMIPILLRSLRDSDGTVRAQASRGLGDLDSPELIPSLQALAKDPDADVADAARLAIARYERNRKK
jgi:HEAT repeat protein